METDYLTILYWLNHGTKFAKEKKELLNVIDPLQMITIGSSIVLVAAVMPLA